MACEWKYFFPQGLLGGKAIRARVDKKWVNYNLHWWAFLARFQQILVPVPRQQSVPELWDLWSHLLQLADRSQYRWAVEAWHDRYACHWCPYARAQPHRIYAEPWSNGCCLLFFDGYKTGLEARRTLFWAVAHWSRRIVKLRRLELFIGNRAWQGLSFQLSNLVTKVRPRWQIHPDVVPWARHGSNWIHPWSMEHA